MALSVVTGNPHAKQRRAVNLSVLPSRELMGPRQTCCHLISAAARNFVSREPLVTAERLLLLADGSDEVGTTASDTFTLSTSLQDAQGAGEGRRIHADEPSRLSLCRTLFAILLQTIRLMNTCPMHLLVYACRTIHGAHVLRDAVPKQTRVTSFMRPACLLLS
jgi:hypothetical protein